MIAKGTAAVGVLQQRRDARLNFEYSFGKWEFIATEQAGGGSVDRKLLRGNIRGKGVLSKPI